MKELISSPVFSIMISLVAFEIGGIIYRRIKFPLFNPVIIAIVVVMFIIKSLHISVDTYNKGGDIISFFLSPATVILAVPLYKKMKLLKKNLLPIISGITAGSLAGIFSTVFLCRLFHISKQLTLSMIPKSVTVPVSMAVSKQIGGIPAITIFSTMLSAIIIIVICPIIFKIFRIKDGISKGVALGTSANALGTSKAIEMGEIEGAMSSLSIGLAGIVVVIFSPIIVKLLGNFIK